MFYVLFFPLAAEHKWPSVICAALMNGSTSSAKSKTRGHGRHHRWFVNRQGVWASRQQGHTVEAAGGMEGGTDQCGGCVSREVQEKDRREATLNFQHCKIHILINDKKDVDAPRADVLCSFSRFETGPFFYQVKSL